MSDYIQDGKGSGYRVGVNNENRIITQSISDTRLHHTAHYYKQAFSARFNVTPKTNWDFVRLSCGNPAFGSGADAFRASNVVGTSEGYIPVIDLTSIMPPFGIKLEHGSQQKLIFEVRDDTTGVDAFDCIAYGFEKEIINGHT